MENADEEQDREAIWQQRYATLRAARQRAHAQEAVATRPEDTRALALRVGKQRLALPLARVSGVLPLTSEQVGAPVPGAPPEFWGLLLLRGEVCPVFDLGRLLGTESVPGTDGGTTAGHVVFVRDDHSAGSDAPVGWKVDRVEELVDLPVSSDSPGEHAGRFIVRIAESAPDALPLLLLDAPAVLDYLRGSADAAPLPGEDPVSVSVDTVAAASIEEE